MSHENLIPLNERTKEEQRKIQKKAGSPPGKLEEKKPI